jgi:alpha-galactosidase/6-phospho-beta-glucosidase family protein
MTKPNTPDSRPVDAPRPAKFPLRPVLAVVGAGSLVWGRSIVVDLMNNPDLAGAEIRLIDVLPKRLEMVREWVEFARVALGGSLLARCCRSFDEELLLEALSLDALVPADKGVTRRLMREMIEFQKESIFPPGVADKS